MARVAVEGSAVAVEVCLCCCLSPLRKSHFKNNAHAPIYRRFRDRMAPDGLLYISSWIDESLTRCYQLMETNDRTFIDKWIANWSDLIDFEVHPVISSAEATQKIAPRL